MAEKSDGFRARVGAVILDKKGRVISSGFNKRKTHPLQVHYGSIKKPYLHAEMSALVNARKKGHTIVVARITKNGDLGLAKPCPVCAAAIADAGIKRVIYTVNNDTYVTVEM